MGREGEPGSSGDTARATDMVRLVEGLDLDSADGRAGLGALLREIEQEAPGAIQRLLDDVRLQKLRRFTPDRAH